MEFRNHTTIIAATASNGTASNAAPHRKNAAQRTRTDSPYQGRSAQKDNPTQLIIKQAVDFLIRQVEAGKSETLAAYLTAMARFHNYSFGNIVAIARQRPTATRVAGFGTWKEMGRFVKRGEKGIQILAPMIGYRRKNAEAAQNTDAEGNTKPQSTLIGFRAVYVFDVAQTEGEDLPEFEHNISGEVGEQRDRLIDFFAQQNIALEFNERIAPALGVSYGGKIALLPGQTEPEEFVTRWFMKRRMNSCTRPSTPAPSPPQPYAKRTPKPWPSSSVRQLAWKWATLRVTTSRCTTAMQPCWPKALRLSNAHQP